MGSTAYNTTGSHTFIVPTRVYELIVYACGGGGGGASGARLNATTGLVPASGGGGSCIMYPRTLVVAPGQSISIFVGAGGGLSGASTNGTYGNHGLNGQNTTVGSLTFRGGYGGHKPSLGRTAGRLPYGCDGTISPSQQYLQPGRYYAAASPAGSVPTEATSTYVGARGARTFNTPLSYTSFGANAGADVVGGGAGGPGESGIAYSGTSSSISNGVPTNLPQYDVNAVGQGGAGSGSSRAATAGTPSSGGAGGRGSVLIVWADW